MSEPTTRQPCAQRNQRHVNKGAVKNNLFRTIALIATVFCGTLSLFAQSTGSATIRGLVTDPQGSVVSNATVSLFNERTGDWRQTITNGQGQYNFSAILPDTYSLQAETTSGFKLYKETGLTISPSDTRGEDVTLEIGGRDETITVSGELAPIQTETGAKESTIAAKQIENLSIIGRSALELTRILPGVVAPDGPNLQQVGFQSGSNASAGYTLNGIRGENNNVSIDGSRVTNIVDNNGTMIIRNPDMVQEVKVQTRPAPSPCSTL